MNTCATCINWRLQSGPRWAARIGMAPCAVKNTQAVTMSHWTACADWRAQADDVVTARLEWLQAKGLMRHRNPIATTPI